MIKQVGMRFNSAAYTQQLIPNIQTCIRKSKSLSYLRNLHIVSLIYIRLQ